MFWNNVTLSYCKFVINVTNDLKICAFCHNWVTRYLNNTSWFKFLKHCFLDLLFPTNFLLFVLTVIEKDMLKSVTKIVKFSTLPLVFKFSNVLSAMLLSTYLKFIIMLSSWWDDLFSLMKCIFYHS